MAPVAAPTPAPITAPLAVLLQPFFVVVVVVVVVFFRLIDYYSFLLGFYLCHFCMESITLCFPLPLPWNQQLSSQPLNPFFLDFYKKQLKGQCYKI
jgi:hypothetical protein